MAKYKIAVKLITGQIFTYNVDDYNVEDGFVYFIDTKVNKELCFWSGNCQIESEVEK